MNNLTSKKKLFNFIWEKSFSWKLFYLTFIINDLSFAIKESLNIYRTVTKRYTAVNDWPFNPSVAFEQNTGRIYLFKRRNLRRCSFLIDEIVTRTEMFKWLLFSALLSLFLCSSKSLNQREQLESTWNSISLSRYL